AYVRITVSRGEGEIGLDPALCAHPTIVAVATPLVPPPQAWYREGVGLVLVRVRRNTAAALSPRIKSLNMLNNILAKQEAHRAGAFDGVMLNTAGHLTECSTSNLFFVRRGRLCTPAPECGLLEGITREVVLTLAREMGWPLDLGAFGPDDLLAADECFLTNTSLEVLPVQCIDGKPVGSGRPGPVTTRLKAAFRANLERFLHLS
ncbi:MAG: aminotransferase class IV, partial [Nitrospirales bacterium]